MNIKQKKILRKLVLKNGQKYSQLMNGFSYEDKFAYHLKYLVNNKFINKRNNAYYLTNKGMTQTAYFNKQTYQDYKFKIPMFMFVVEIGNKYFLRNHFGGDNKRGSHYCLPSAIINWGEDLNIVIDKSLKDKYGIVVEKKKYRCCLRLRTLATNNTCIFDDLIVIYDIKAQKLEDDHLLGNKSFSISAIKQLKTHFTVGKFILEDCHENFSDETIIYNYGFLEEDIVE